MISTILGFFESLIWLLAIRQIFENLDNMASYIAYPMGFAAGILVGMIIEVKLALGKVVVRVISGVPFDEVLPYVEQNHMRYTIIQGETADSREGVLFTVLRRDDLSRFLEEIRIKLPNSFYTVESVKKASEAGIMPQEGRRSIGAWLGSVKRK